MWSSASCFKTEISNHRAVSARGSGPQSAHKARGPGIQRRICVEINQLRTVRVAISDVHSTKRGGLLSNCRSGMEVVGKQYDEQVCRVSLYDY